MTTIVAKEVEGDVKFAYDSQCTGPYGIDELEFSKVFTNGELILGCSGAVRDANILKFAKLAQPDFNHRAEPNRVDMWVTNQLIPSILQALSDQRASTVENGKVSSDNSTLLVVAGRVYRIGHDGSWVRNTHGYYAVGSGSDFALGALAAGAGLTKAIKAAAAHDLYTGGTLFKTTAKELLSE